MGLHPFIHLSGPVDLVMAPQYLVQSFLGIPPLGAEHGPLRHVQCGGHLGGGPALIYLDQDAGPVIACAELLPALIIFLSRPFSCVASRTPYFSCTMTTSHPTTLRLSPR